MTELIIILNDLPKISLNKWYAGSHWTKRKKIKDSYTLLIKSMTGLVFSKTNFYEVDYLFEFANSPLDASNCSAMVKLIEDVIFESDSYKVVRSISIKSRRGKKNKVTIKVKMN